MNKINISNKILDWYDNNKRDLPWRKPKSKKQSHYFTLVSEVMLQQTQVKTVIPFFKRFVGKIPNIKKLAKIEEKKLLKLWEGLGYYSRAKNLRKSAKLILKNKNCLLPDNITELKKLPGIGEYTSRAILALEFNIKTIPIDANIERLIKRVLLLKKNHELEKKNLITKSNFFGYSYRQRDYVQALMELGALVCKPIDPLCGNCPISDKCKSFKNSDFKIIKKSKKNKIKYFKADIYLKKNKILLIRNQKFNFLRDLLILPMKEIREKDYKHSLKQKTQIKMSNMDMKILINKNKKIPHKKGKFINYKNKTDVVLPSFTKKLFRVALNK